MNFCVEVPSFRFASFQVQKTMGFPTDPEKRRSRAVISSPVELSLKRPSLRQGSMEHCTMFNPNMYHMLPPRRSRGIANPPGKSSEFVCAIG